MSNTAIGRWVAEVLDVPMRWLDRPLRSRMTDYGYFVLEGDYEPAIEGLAEIERAARSKAVAGWANAGLAFTLLAASRWDEAQLVAARHPDPASQPLLGLALELRRGHLDPGFAVALSESSYAIAAQGTARVITAEDHLGDVTKQVLEASPAVQSRALLALQMGLHLNRDHRAAIGVGEVLHERQPTWELPALWVAIGWAALEDEGAVLRWLERAADAGFSAVGAIDREPLFEAMRTMPAFAEIRSRMLANPPHPNDTRQGGLLWTRPRGDRAPVVRRP
jgi:hypothetical protein